jgi:hypothetical protein
MGQLDSTCSAPPRASPRCPRGRACLAALFTSLRNYLCKRQTEKRQATKTLSNPLTTSPTAIIQSSQSAYCLRINQSTQQTGAEWSGVEWSCLATLKAKALPRAQWQFRTRPPFYTSAERRRRSGTPRTATLCRRTARRDGAPALLEPFSGSPRRSGTIHALTNTGDEHVEDSKSKNSVTGVNTL